MKKLLCVLLILAELAAPSLSGTAENLDADLEEVTVTEKVTDNETVLTLIVNPADMGKVIGKQGRIAKAIRTVLKAQAVLEDKKVTLDIGLD